MEKEKLQFYKSLGLKLTPQRLAILEYLENAKNHPSAEDIYIFLKEKYPSISYATVYNTLEVLATKGLIKELNLDSSKKRFEPFLHQHHHFVCKNCKEIVDVEGKIDIFIPEELKKFEVLDYQVVFTGLCENCRKNLS